MFYGLTEFEEHLCHVVHTISFKYEFDWIVPQGGLLHFEMNAAKAFMSCNWPVFMEEICTTLGFKSDNAKKYIRKGSDHHKLWETLEITYLAMADELLLQKRTRRALMDIGNTVKIRVILITCMPSK